MITKTLIIDPEFESLIPPLSKDEFRLLEESIKADGCRDAIMVQAGTDIIIDGHNRYKICTALNEPFDLSDIHFDTRDAALNWIDRNQLGRRNVKPDVFQMIIGRMYNRAKKSVSNETGKNQHSGEVSGHNDHQPKDTTAAKIAAEHNTSEKTVRRAAAAVQVVEDEAQPEIQQAVRTGQLPVQVAAKVAKLPIEKQREIASAPEPKKAAKEATAVTKTLTAQPAFDETEAIATVQQFVNNKLTQWPKDKREMLSECLLQLSKDVLL